MKKLLFLLALLPSFAFSSGIYNPGGSTDLLPGDTNYIWNTSTLQEPSTFYVDAGYVQNLLELNFLTQGSILFAGASGVISQDNSYLFYDATNHYFGLGLNTPTSLLHTVGIKPADNGSAQGTNAGVNILLRGAIGGDTTIGTTGTGGVGGQIQIFGGVGGNAQSASTVSSGGVGGSIAIQAGAGGVPNNAASVENGGAGGGFVLSGGLGARPLGSGAIKNGGNGGAFTMNGGGGGNGNTGNGGDGGGFGMIGGSGGSTSISGTGGAGGSFTLFAGGGGSGVTGGNGGNYTFTGSRGGNGTTGDGGNGSAMTFTAGNGGQSTGGGNAGTAGDINFNAGDGNTGATNSNGGSIYFAPGVAVAPATTGYVYLGVDNTGAVQGHVVAGLLAIPSSATFTSYASSADAASAVFVSTTGQTRNLTEWVFGSSTQVYVSSIGIVGVSTITAVRQIRWADGTIQVSSPPAAGASGGGASALAVANNGVQKTSPTVGIDFGYGINVGVIGSTAMVSLSNSATGYIQNTQTLQSGATFYVSSGTVAGQFNVNTNGSGASANINGPLTVDRPDLGTGLVNRAQMFFDPNTSAAKLQFKTYNPIAPDPQIAWYDNSGNNYAYISVPPSPTNITMRISSGTGITPVARWSIGGNSSQGFYSQDQLEVFRVDIGSASLRYGNQLQFNDNGNNFYTALRSTPTGTYNQIYYLPSSTGSAGQVLSVNKVYGDHVDTAWITPSAGSGDNLGNHLATTTLSMQGFSLTNIGTSSSVFGTNGNLTVNSSATFVSTVTFNGVSTTTYSAGTALDMTAATFVLPTAASPPTNAVGQFGLDTTDSVIVGSTGTTTPLVFGDPMVQFTATISTDSTSIWQGRNVPIWQNKSNMDVAIDTITATTYSVAASTLAFQLQSRPYNALNSNGTNIFTSTQPATWTGWTTTSFSSATIKANNYLVFFATTTTPDTGTVNSIIVSVRGRKIVR